MSDMIIRLQVPETDITFLRHGQGARVFVQSTHAVFPASVYAISPAGDTDPKTNTVRYEVLVDVFGEGEKLLPGMTTDVTIPVESKKNVLWVPLEYVYENNEGPYVLIGEDLKKRRVQTGLRTTDTIEIISGLTYGDKVSRIRVLDPNEFDIVKL
jgi:multidrug efflux pump subunit AcrA (membrane-fusion protein)